MWISRMPVPMLSSGCDRCHKLGACAVSHPKYGSLGQLCCDCEDVVIAEKEDEDS